jgi:hypothetical protein
VIRLSTIIKNPPSVMMMPITLKKYHKLLTWQKSQIRDKRNVLWEEAKDFQEQVRKSRGPWARAPFPCMAQPAGRMSSLLLHFCPLHVDLGVPSYFTGFCLKHIFLRLCMSKTCTLHKPIHTEQAAHVTLCQLVYHTGHFKAINNDLLRLHCLEDVLRIQVHK